LLEVNHRKKEFKMPVQKGETSLLRGICFATLVLNDGECPKRGVYRKKFINLDKWF